MRSSRPEEQSGFQPRSLRIEQRLLQPARITGAMASALLAKGLSIDLHPRAFKPGDTAITLLAHIVIQLWQVDEGSNFDLRVPRATHRP